MKELRAPSPAEQLFLLGLSGAIGLFVILDLIADVRAHASPTHLIIDTVLGIASVLGVLFAWARLGRSRLQLASHLAQSEREKNLARRWKSRAQELEEGLSAEIDKQMDAWGLSTAEKEVGLLLLKGLSLKEISQIRGTSDRTIRHQSLSVYAKAGVTGRAELSAYFLEEFLDRGTHQRSRKQKPAAHVSVLARQSL